MNIHFERAKELQIWKSKDYLKEVTETHSKTWSNIISNNLVFLVYTK